MVMLFLFVFFQNISCQIISFACTCELFSNFHILLYYSPFLINQYGNIKSKKMKIAKRSTLYAH